MTSGTGHVLDMVAQRLHSEPDRRVRRVYHRGKLLSQRGSPVPRLDLRVQCRRCGAVIYRPQHRAELHRPRGLSPPGGNPDGRS